MKVKSIYSTGIALQLRKVGILEMTGRPNILALDLKKLVNLTKSDFIKARGIGAARAEQLDHVRNYLVELLVTNN